jgi:hypothetical protein
VKITDDDEVVDKEEEGGGAVTIHAFNPTQTLCHFAVLH